MRNRANFADTRNGRGHLGARRDRGDAAPRPRSVEPIAGLFDVMREEYRKYEFESTTDRLSRILDRGLAAHR